MKLIRFNAWVFFKRKKKKLKTKKRKYPNYLFLFFLFKLETPRYIEVDYLTLTVFLLRGFSVLSQHTYYLNKFFSFRFFSLYNYKKIN